MLLNVIIPIACPQRTNGRPHVYRTFKVPVTEVPRDCCIFCGRTKPTPPTEPTCPPSSK